MDAFLQKFQHLKIQLEEITSATDNFNDEKNCIGVGGFGRVYKGEVSHSQGRSVVAIKRLDGTHGQGAPEFLKEITTLSDYRHENLISLLGFCCEGCEMILVYEHASRGSLDRHLSSPHLTWIHRLKICLDVAKGLSYLHDPRETHRRLIHCDIKSGNILLDDQWNAKVSDLGLSIIGSANEQHSVIITLAAGTAGYIDPQYRMTHTLTKESDVYSFGVVLFEVLCGRLCSTYRNGRVEKIFVKTWIESYKQKKINDIIYTNQTIQQLDSSAIEIYSDITYRCLNESREDRPKMAEVVIALETALERQELSEGKLPRFIYEEMTKAAQPPLNYGSKAELWKLLSEGVLLNGKTRFSLNKKGEHCQIITFAECMISGPTERRHVTGSRTVRYMDTSVGTHVKTQFLSPGITYMVNLLFKFRSPDKDVRNFYCISLKFKLQGETKTSISYLAYEREDGWWVCELYQFISDHKTADLEILFDFNGRSWASIEAGGIEFRPLENVEPKDEEQPISDSDVKWEEKLPTDYEDIMTWSTSSLQWATKKEAYSIMGKGFLIDDGEKWFFLDTNGKKCLMLSARVAVKGSRNTDTHCLSFPESRFGEAVHCDSRILHINSKIQFQRVSSQTTYAGYLVYKTPKNQSGFEGPVKVKLEKCGSDESYIYLVSPQTPVVIRPKADHNTHNPLNMPRIKGLPRQRNDGWMEVQIWEFQIAITTEMIPMHLELTKCDGNKFSTLFVQGIEFRPI